MSFAAGSELGNVVAALGADDEELRTRCASVLALLDTPGAQRSLVDLALDTANSDSLRVAAFDSLAESANRYTNRLDDPRVDGGESPGWSPGVLLRCPALFSINSSRSEAIDS